MSSAADTIRREICEIGRRMYDRQYAAAHDGNISYRLSDDEVLCTPTRICKGFMRPEDLCVVDLDGRQVAGERNRTSEVLVHLEIYRRDPQARAVVHCHPPHATAFGVAGEPIPSCIMPEVEFVLGVVPLAPYETPGTAAVAETIRPHIGRANTIILSNHGTLSWADTIEEAYWYTEILENYCRILLLARQLGRARRLPDDKVHELLDMKEQAGGPVDWRRATGVPLRINEAFAPELR